MQTEYVYVQAEDVFNICTFTLKKESSVWNNSDIHTLIRNLHPLALRRMEFFKYISNISSMFMDL
jgi:hypothetical protein